MPEAQEQQSTHKGSKANMPLKKDGSRMRRVKVHRTDENRHAPITVYVNEPKNKREFFPGQAVELSEQLIEALKLAREESMIEIPENSGIYEAENPRLEAQAQNPGWDVETDFSTGTLYLKRSSPRYVIEYLDN